MSCRPFLVACISFMLVGCNHEYFDARECAYWRNLLENDRAREEVRDWADEKILGRVLVNEERTLGRLVFPGWHGAVRRSVLADGWPSALQGAEVRPIYFADDGSVGGIFIGRRNGTGLFIDRSDLSRMIERGNDPSVSREAFGLTMGRIALTCSNTDR